MRLGILTDIHHCPPGSPPDGWHNQHQFADVAERLERSIQWLENEGVDRLAVLGDLTHFGDLASMREVIEIFGQSQVPCWILPGNHDLTADGSTLVEVLSSVGGASVEPIDGQTIPFGPSWFATGLEMERAGPGIYQASSQPDVAGWGDAPVLVLSHFPVLSLQTHCADAGLKYAGDLANRNPIGAAVLGRTAPTLVIHGHLHVRQVVTDGSGAAGVLRGAGRVAVRGHCRRFRVVERGADQLDRDADAGGRSGGATVAIGAGTGLDVGRRNLADLIRQVAIGRHKNGHDEGNPTNRCVLGHHVAGVASISMSAGISNGSPVVNSSVPRTIAGSSPAPRAVWMTSSS